MKNIAKRFYDMIIKLMSVKTIPAAVFTIGYFKAPDAVNATFCLLAWALVVGMRYAEKVNGLVKGKD